MQIEFILYISGLADRRRVTPRACGARCIRYTARLEIATVVPRALARCRFSKSHHRPARVARASSVVAPARFLNRILCRNRQFCTVFQIFTHWGSKFSGCFYTLTSTYDPYEPWKVSWKSARPFFFQKFGRQTDGRTDRRGNFIYYIDSGCDDVRPVLAQEQCVSSSLHQWRVEAAASDNVDLDEWTSLRSMFSNHNNNHNNYVHSTFVYLTKPRPHQQQCPSNIRLCCHKRQLVSWSLTCPFSANMAISETKGQGWRAIPTQWRKARHKMQQCNDYLLVYCKLNFT